MATILDRIVETKWRELAEAKAHTPVAELEKALAVSPVPKGFVRAIRDSRTIAVIAEVKKASPSAGIIRPQFDPVVIAQSYANHGATCISVLTDETYFQGCSADLRAVSAAVPCPTLRKDFVVDRYQLLEARAWGASAALLIAEILPGKQLKVLFDEARAMGLDVLVEFHDAEELQRVIDTGAELVGINNRDLRTFVTRLDNTLNLLAKIPSHVMVVSESGIRTTDEVKLLEKAGVRAILVGETLMRQPDVGVALDHLLGRVVVA